MDADHTVTIANTVIVPAERAYTSDTTLTTSPFIASGVNRVIALIRLASVSAVCGRIAHRAISSGIMDRKRKKAVLAAKAEMFFFVICQLKSRNI